MSTLFETGVRPAIDAYLLEESKKVRSYGDYWSASSAGYCMRKVIFERLGVPKIEQEGDARKQRVFTSGHIFHQWIQDITKEAGLSIASEVELQDEDLMVRGHFDDLVLVDDAPVGGVGKRTHLILYDYKTVNSRSFMWAKKNGNAMSHYHRLQLGTYMYMLRNKSSGGWYVPRAHFPVDPNNKGGEGKVLPLEEARILKIEKDTLMMMEQQLLWDTQLESDVLSYWNELNTYWKTKKLPECSCADHENGFMAKELYNGYYFEGEPCSIKLYEKWKEENDI